MKLNYFADTDSLYIDLSEQPSVRSREISDGVVLDYDANGNLVGIDIDNASLHEGRRRVGENLHRFTRRAGHHDHGAWRCALRRRWAEPHRKADRPDRVACLKKENGGALPDSAIPALEPVRADQCSSARQLNRSLAVASGRARSL